MRWHILISMDLVNQADSVSLEKLQTARLVIFC